MVNKTENIRKNYKLTPKKREEVVRRYIIGEKLTTLTKEYGITKESIRILVKNRGYVTDRRKISMEEIKNYRKISEDFCNNIIFSKREIIGSRRIHPSTKYSINENAFGVITPESAYWIGFLMADGNVFNNVVTLRLSNEDKYQVEEFRKFLGSNHKISIISPKDHLNGLKRNEAYQLAFNSKQICCDLLKFGITPKKSITAKIIDLENNRHFWRGMMDGDGTIYGSKSNNHLLISLMGSKEIIYQFYNYIKIFCPHIRGKPRIHKKNRNTWDMRASGKEAAIIMDVIYHNSSISLPRKSSHALELIANFIKNHGQDS